MGETGERGGREETEETRELQEARETTQKRQWSHRIRVLERTRETGVFGDLGRPGSQRSQKACTRC